MAHPLILQASAWYPPYSVGGTEVYLEGLVDGLARLGVSSHVVTPRPDTAPAHYEHRQIPVATYPVPPWSRTPNGEGRELAAFRSILQDHQAAIYHQHSWTRGCGPAHLRAAREAGLRTVMTVHTPSPVCLRGVMMRFGRSACDGRLRQQPCAACWAHGRGAPRGLADGLGSLPASLARLAREGGGKLGTALAASAVARDKTAEFQAMVADADRIVAVCQWLYDALLSNGVDPARLSLSRQGVAASFAASVRRNSRRHDRTTILRLLYLGRWHPVKGLDLVVRAIAADLELPVELVIHAVGDGPEEDAYRAQVNALAGQDPRIIFAAPLARERIAETMQAFDALVVPSTWLETGPLVVLEARAAGLFVLGAGHGGISELIRSPDHGLLVTPPGDVAAWRAAIRQLVEHRPKTSPQIVRTMDAAAADMAELYQTLN